MKQTSSSITCICKRTRLDQASPEPNIQHRIVEFFETMRLVLQVLKLAAGLGNVSVADAFDAEYHERGGDLVGTRMTHDLLRCLNHEFKQKSLVSVAALLVKEIWIHQAVLTSNFSFLRE